MRLRLCGPGRKQARASIANVVLLRRISSRSVSRDAFSALCLPSRANAKEIWIHALAIAPGAKKKPGRGLHCMCPSECAT